VVRSSWDHRRSIVGLAVSLVGEAIADLVVSILGIWRRARLWVRGISDSPTPILLGLTFYRWRIKNGVKYHLQF
jgi:hypothetical protein